MHAAAHDVHVNEKQRQGEHRKSDARCRDKAFPGEPCRPGGDGVGGQDENRKENRRAAGEHSGFRGARCGKLRDEANPARERARHDPVGSRHYVSPQNRQNGLD